MSASQAPRPPIGQGDRVGLHDCKGDGHRYEVPLRDLDAPVQSLVQKGGAFDTLSRKAEEMRVELASQRERSRILELALVDALEAADHSKQMPPIDRIEKRRAALVALAAVRGVEVAP